MVLRGAQVRYRATWNLLTKYSVLHTDYSYRNYFVLVLRTARLAFVCAPASCQCHHPQAFSALQRTALCLSSSSAPRYCPTRLPPFPIRCLTVSAPFPLFSRPCMSYSVRREQVFCVAFARLCVCLSALRRPGPPFPMPPPHEICGCSMSRTFVVLVAGSLGHWVWSRVWVLGRVFCSLGRPDRRKR